MITFLTYSFFLVLSAEIAKSVYTAAKPTFEQLSRNSPFNFINEVVKVAEGQTAVLTCVFDNAFELQTSNQFSYNQPWTEEIPIDKIIWIRHLGATEKSTLAEGTDLIRQRDNRDGLQYQVAVPHSSIPMSMLIIRRISQKVKGYYSCKCKASRFRTKVFYLNVVRPILSVLHTGQLKYFVEDKSRLTLFCNATNNFPATTVYWTRREHRRAEKAGVFQGWGPKYEILRASEYSEGLYTCHVNNYLSAPLTVTYNVRVGKPQQKQPSAISATYNGIDPSFMKSSNAGVPKYNQLYMLSCRSNGVDIKFKWFRNKTDITQQRDWNIAIHSTSDRVGSTISDLIIKKFKPQDRNYYSCEAENSGGKKTFTFAVDRIRGLPRFMKDNREKYAPKMRLKLTTDDEDLLRAGSGSGPVEGSGDGDSKIILSTSASPVITASNTSTSKTMTLPTVSVEGSGSGENKLQDKTIDRDLEGSGDGAAATGSRGNTKRLQLSILPDSQPYPRAQTVPGNGSAKGPKWAITKNNKRRRRDTNAAVKIANNIVKKKENNVLQWIRYFTGKIKRLIR